MFPPLRIATTMKPMIMAIILPRCLVKNSAEKNVEERGVSLTESRESEQCARAHRSITQRLFSLRGTGQGILAGCDCRRARVLQLLGLNRVELDVFREF